jgi:hypothetical protein
VSPGKRWLFIGIQVALVLAIVGLLVAIWLPALIQARPQEMPVR